jgi:3',5'-cyclic AMP phosphodiesterase CpdA
MKRFLKIFGYPLFGILIFALGFAIANRISERAMHEFIDSFSPVEYEAQLTPRLDEDGAYYFTTDGDFKIMHLTDVHITGGVLGITEDKKAINAVAAMITEEKPDFVVVTGDIVFPVPWSGTINNRFAHELFGHLMERLGVYWTITLGNHDSEAYNFYNRRAVAKMYSDEALSHCLFTVDDGGIYGEGNHAVYVKNSLGLITKTLIMMDSNAYTDADPLGINWIYDNIHDDQIEWYRNTVTKYSAYNKAILTTIPDEEKPENIESFTTVQSLIFLHIPIMEARDAVNEYLEENGDGENVKHHFGKIGEEAPYVYCSEIEEKMFETILSLGSSKAMFFGHDHLNNTVLEYKGFIFSYGYSIDYFAYDGIDQIGSQRGCTVINCAPDTSFEIIHENYYQDKYTPLYEKESVDLTN